MITVVIPAYNEEEVIKKLIEDLEGKISVNQALEILVVNDGSTDHTGEILDRLSHEYRNLRVIHHQINQNLGGALRTGIHAAGGDIIVTLDADMTHPPELLAEMAEILRDYDVCVASRFVEGGGMVNVPRYRVVISRIANIVYQFLFHSPVKDNTTGYKAYRAELLKSIEIEELGFSVQLEIVTKLLRKRTRFKEVPFLLTNRKLGSSKLRYLSAIPHYVKRVMKLFFIRWFGVSES
jgi:dolichol-phosphate mannosyltransferase